MNSRKNLDLNDYIEGIKSKDRTILSRSISLVESQKPEDMELAEKLLQALKSFEGKSFRVGITGVPGAGKSTFINTLGTYLCNEGKNVAVLTIDPSSTLTGGSILGDKTRMNELSFHEKAYIRPSPSLGHLGGVAARTRESILICEAFGFDYIFIESVGVGQSEQEIASMVDLSLLLTITGAGDDLQGIKRGLLEVADWILINKADGENKERAIKAKADFKSAFQILKSSQIDTKVEAISSITKEGIPELAKDLQDWFTEASTTKDFKEKRKKQQLIWFHKMVEQKILFATRANKVLQKQIKEGELAINNSESHPIDISIDIKI